MKNFLLFMVATFVCILFYGAAKFYVGKFMDYSDRPWAYSRDENAVLLVGKWREDLRILMEWAKG